MKLFRYGPAGTERPAVVDANGRVVDVSTIVPDFDAPLLNASLIDRLSPVALDSCPTVDLTNVRIGAPLVRPGAIHCIGLNYKDHAAEAGMAEPAEPIVFAKAGSSLGGPDDPIPFTTDMAKLDWEVELGVVIGTKAFNIDEAAALDAVFGYTIVNDVSERAWQLERGGQWGKGKSYPGFCPVGPWIVTRDEVPDPQALALRLELNGTVRQDGNSAQMIFPVAKIVSYLSRFCRLEPGDIICTGTPAGVGSGCKPPLFLTAGDRLRLSVTGLGEQNQTVQAA